MGRRKKLDFSNISNGKIWDDNNNLEQKLGYSHPYQKLSLDDYEKEVRAMTTLDLQTHACEVLVPVKNNRELLIANLIKEFKIRKS